jgi:hypothetical protein
VRSAKFAQGVGCTEEEELYDACYKNVLNVNTFLSHIMTSTHRQAGKEIEAEQRKNLAREISSIQSLVNEWLPNEEYTPPTTFDCYGNEVLLEDNPSKQEILEPRYEGHILEEISDGPENDHLYSVLATSSKRTDSIVEPTTEEVETKDLPPPPRPTKPYLAVPFSFKHRPGKQSAGISVLSVRGSLTSPDKDYLDLRLDSGADISLLSYEFYQSMMHKPVIKRGDDIILQPLVGEERVRGYVELPIYIPAASGEVLKFMMEAYLVPRMLVPILLGEDFQQKYELGVRRNVKSGTVVQVPAIREEIAAQHVGQNFDLPVIKQKVSNVQAFVKAKSSTQARSEHRAKTERETDRSQTIRVKNDCFLQPDLMKLVEVECDAFEDNEDREWLLEKTLLADADESFFPIPNVLLTGKFKRIPMTNTSTFPRALRKGEPLGLLIDPAHFFDSPKTENEKQRLEEAARRTALIIETCAEAQSHEKQSEIPRTDEPLHQASSGKPSNVHKEEGSTNPAEEPEDSSQGPKTAKMDDPETLSSRDMRSLIDVGDLPDHLKDKAWAMLERNVDAFGFDDRLGDYPAVAQVRLKEGTEPIAVLMYGASLQKKAVIEEQVRKWFEAGVIKASNSPWSTPVVIAYRNGKARLCIDYRKLNAATISDEFPIPRQSEILSALSGAQVILGLDALAGFTQIGMFPDDIELTAFCTHLGLYQFKRMPFGLKNGPSIFQRVMQGVLAPYLWMFCLVYIDDIVVYSKTYKEHIDHLDKVLTAMREAKLTLSPKKCHLFYSSILLLGHKVSRLGLSTHEEKVKAISELNRPTKVSQLQTFLGMVVYFSAFIPFYAGTAAPLFALLRKGATWKWGEEEEHAFESCKLWLQRAPVRGHPIQGRPYRLYTDASDEALGCALQQIQPIQVADLRSTKAYDKVEAAWKSKNPVPRLTVSMKTVIQDNAHQDVWAESLDDTVVHVKQVIAYYSHSFNGAERRYSTTEREALGAKEGLVKFQPFIEGEKIILITDHSALQWAKTYENHNRRLASWGVIYLAFAPNLEIVHRPGRVHANVDPLSRLPRAPPPHTSPSDGEVQPIVPESNVAAAQERSAAQGPARTATASFAAAHLSDCLEEIPTPAMDIRWARSLTTQTRYGRQTKKPRPVDDIIVGRVVKPKRAKASTKKDSSHMKVNSTQETGGGNHGRAKTLPEEAVFDKDLLDDDTPDEEKTPYERDRDRQPPPRHIQVAMADDVLERWVAGYPADVTLAKHWKQAVDQTESSWYPGERFYKDSRGLLYFRDADFAPQLCVPRSEVLALLTQSHESATLTAHSGSQKLYETLADRFYWHCMTKDIKRFCESCDICQKIKPINFGKFGHLHSNPIPTRPYESVSLDLIGPLPESDGYTAILVIVDRLSKHAQFIPTIFKLKKEGFAHLFVKHVACRYGLPDSIFADRDGRWFSGFWRLVSKQMNIHMALSSSHHPQHNGQMEIVNRRLEWMIRGYVAEDRTTWAKWLHLIELAYNSSPHASTRNIPFRLLLGFVPKNDLDFLHSSEQRQGLPRSSDPEVDCFIKDLDMHRQAARSAIAKSQVVQASAYNSGRRLISFKEGDLVLVNPHTLEWIESDDKGVKLTQRWIGPFEVHQRINADTY